MRLSLLRPVLVALLALLTLIPASAAFAHTSLVGTDPEEGAQVETLEQVSLEFSGAVLDLGTTLALVQDDARVELEPTFPTETTVVADVSSLPAGDWTLVFRVVAEDGHPLEGEVSFTVLSGSEPTALPEATATASSAPAASSSASAVASATPSAVAIAASASPSPSQETAGEEGDRTGGIARLLGAGVLIAVVAAAIVWARRRGSGATDDGLPGDGEAQTDGESPTEGDGETDASRD